jgi:hypothetical protein
MTQGQRAIIGWTVAAIISLAIWVLAYSVASAQRAPQMYRGPVQITVQFTNAQNVESLCGMITNGRLHNVEACANERIMILPDPCIYPGRYAEIVCHERGHVLGWVHREPRNHE